MRQVLYDVRDFHERFDLPCGLTQDGKMLEQSKGPRIARVEEEARELVEAIRSGDPVAIVQEALDVIYVAAGAIVEMGLDPEIAAQTWEALQRGNMMKERLPGADKITKPPGWERPNFGALVGPGLAACPRPGARVP